MDKNMTSKTQNRVKLDPFWGALRPPLKRRRFEGVFDPESKSWTKTDPKMVKKRSKMTKFGVKMTKIGSNLGFGVKVGDFWGKKGRSAHQKWAKGHFRGLKIGFDKDFWQEVRPIAGNPEFPGLVWKGWRGKFGRMIFCYKNEKSVWKFLMNEIGKNENNVIFFVTNEKYGNYFDSSLRLPILTDLSLVSLKSLMNEF